jgi:sigma-B regulation protein RsbU (phosphoserine phosphatase)
MSNISNKDIHLLQDKINELEGELAQKDLELVQYRKQLVLISQNLDQLMQKSNMDHQMLLKVQNKLIPKTLPKIPGFEFSKKFVYGTESGGDYFDIFELEDKFRFAVLVSSSSGYSMSALFLSLILKISHHLQAKKGMSPELMIQQMADELKTLASPQDFTHVFYSVIDRRDLSFKFCCVGQVYGFYITKNKLIKKLSSDYGPIGINFSERLLSAEFNLEADSRICLLTENLFNIIGENLILQIFQDFAFQEVHQLRNELLFQAQKKSGLKQPLRDQTVVVIDVKDQLIKLAKS